MGGRGRTWGDAYAEGVRRVCNVLGGSSGIGITAKMLISFLSFFGNMSAIAIRPIWLRVFMFRSCEVQELRLMTRLLRALAAGRTRRPQGRRRIINVYVGWRPVVRRQHRGQQRERVDNPSIICYIFGFKIEALGCVAGQCRTGVQAYEKSVRGRTSAVWRASA